ncbi:ParA family protein [Streptomyces incanus]
MLAESGRRVLVLDGDPQCNATTGFRIRAPGPNDLTQAMVVLDALDPIPLIRETKVPGIYVLPASFGDCKMFGSVSHALVTGCHH